MPFQGKPLDVRLPTIAQGFLNRSMMENQQMQEAAQSRLANANAAMREEELGSYRLDAPVRAAERPAKIQEFQRLEEANRQRKSPEYQERLKKGEMADADMKVYRAEAEERANRADKVLEILDPIFGQQTFQGDFVGDADRLQTALLELHAAGLPGVDQLRRMDPEQSMQILGQQYYKAQNTSKVIRDRISKYEQQQRELEQIDRKGQWSVRAAATTAGSQFKQSTDQALAAMLVQYQNGTLPKEQYPVFRAALINARRQKLGASGEKEATEYAYQSKRALEKDMKNKSMFESGGIAANPDYAPYVEVRNGKAQWKNATSPQEFFEAMREKFFSDPIDKSFGFNQQRTVQKESSAPASADKPINARMSNDGRVRVY